MRALRAADFPTVTALAQDIWRRHYAPIVGQAQVEYMLAGRFTDENLRRYLDSDRRWFELLWRDGEVVGYVSSALDDAQGGSPVATPASLKLEQLYLRHDLQGRGLGGFMLRHIEARAADLDCRTLWLTVNRANASSIAVYRRAGFLVREEAVFDIGGGYVMDDYVMHKPVLPHAAPR